MVFNKNIFLYKSKNRTFFGRFFRMNHKNRIFATALKTKQL